MRKRPVFVVLAAVLVAVLLSVGAGLVAALLVGTGDDAEEFATPSYPRNAESLPTLISDVSESAPGRSIVLAETTGAFTDGHVLFAADSDRVRDVSAIEDRVNSDYGAATTRLSPDGRRLAVGDLSGKFDDILVLDLVTGASQRFSVGGGSTEVLAWSPDGRRLAISSEALDVLDLDTGSVKRVATPSTNATPKTDLLPGEAPMPTGGGVAPKTVDGMTKIQAAFSPDGRSIAYDDGVDIEIYPLDGAGPVVRLTDKAVWLAGASAWSPDGRRVLVTREETNDVNGATSLLAIDVATQNATRLVTFDYIDFSVPIPVGWRSASEVLLSGTDADGAFVVQAYDVDAKRRGDRLMTFGYSTYSAEFASGLIGSAVGRDGDFSGGPTPTWWRAVVGVVVGAVVAVVGAIVATAVGVPMVLRRRSAARRVAPPLPVPAGGGFVPPAYVHLVPGPVPVVPRVSGPGPASASDWVRPR
ncbi:PD40 domain-containing protein [Cryptosporangium arvum]|uniref:Periplasmic component of the Tol biopolymer transport system n=1 Tax=Cryptosporangium arvum DSM 44712 TaxID=927661 RepID=A0A010ZKY4_9ACTN|nr:PD40 domain-containing protein [Cryptosporangium arvum]EXG79284.1 periplasmic component of the Tol biopolymer transport system [Cryptosporangium arvum DSM 44712]